MNTKQNYGASTPGTNQNGSTEQTATTTRRLPVKSYFTLEVSTLAENEIGPSEFDALYLALQESRDKSLTELQRVLTHFGQGIEADTVTLADSVEYGEVFALLTKVKHLNNFTDMMYTGASSILFEYEKDALSNG